MTENETKQNAQDFTADVDMTDVETSNGNAVKTDEVAAPKPAEQPPPVKPVLTGDAEQDERDMISMPSQKTVAQDLQHMNRSRRVVVHTATMYDMVHDVIGEILRNQICDDISFQFVRSKDPDVGMQGVISITFPSTKQATEYVPYIQTIRPDLNIEQAPSTDIATNLISTWKKERDAANPSTDSMLIVKNLDPAAATVDKLTAIFPDADDIVIASQPDASSQGKLKGRKFAYLLYKTKEEAMAALENFAANPSTLDGEILYLSQYRTPPEHIPQGFLPLATRRMVLRHIAFLKGIHVRAQEDPMIEIKPETTARLQRANEYIEKDDAARDVLKLAKPTLTEFKTMTNLKPTPQMQHELLLYKMNLADKPASSANPAKKRPAETGGAKMNKMSRQSAVKPLMGGGGARSGFSPMGRGAGGMPTRFGAGFSAPAPPRTMLAAPASLGRGLRLMRPSSFQSQRMSLLRAARAALMGSSLRHNIW